MSKIIPESGDIEVREIAAGISIIKGYFHVNMVGLYMHDAATDKTARFTWHGVNIGDYAFSPAADRIIAVCVHPPKTQQNDARATVMGYDVRRIHSDLLHLPRERVEGITDAGAYGFIVVRPGYLFRSLAYREDGIYFTSEEHGAMVNWFLRSPGEPPTRI